MGQVSYVTVNGIRIAYEATGSGVPILMLHGFPRTHRTWEKVTPALAERFTVVAPDRRGFGDSDRPDDLTHYDGGTVVSDHVGLMDALGHREFLVVGHDKGAPTARRITLENPDRVLGLTLIDGMPEGTGGGQRDPSGRQWYLDFFRQRGVAEQLIGQNPRLFFSLFLDRNPHLNPEEHEYYLGMFCRRGTVDAILADYRAGSEVDPAYWKTVNASGKKMTTPLLVLWGGRKSVSANVDVVAAWRNVATDVRGEAVDASHYVHEEQPEIVSNRILAFADELGL